MDWFRGEFRVFENYNFLDWGSNSPAPQKAVKAVEEFLDSAAHFPEGSAILQFFKWGGEIDRLKGELAKLLNCSKDEIALTGTSTTQGIQTAFEILSPERGENIVAFDTHWTSELVSTIPELEKWKNRGVEIRLWQNRNLTYDTDDLAKLIDDKTKIVYLDSSTLLGYRFDIEEVIRIAHERNAFVVLDSVQEIGAFQIDTQKLDIDFMAFGGYKYLTTPLGTGVLYVNKKLIDKFEPPHFGYNNIIGPDAGWPELFDNPDVPIPEYKLVNNASKFEYGAFYPYPGVICMASSAGMINSIGIEKVENKIRELKYILISELESIGCKVISPSEKKHWSPMTAVNVGRNLKEDYKVVAELRKLKIIVSARRTPTGLGGIVSTLHYPNNEEDVMKLVENIKRLKNKI